MNIVETKLDILDLISRHSHAIDGTDPNANANIFTEEGTYISRIDGEETVHGRGRKELSDFATGLYEERGDDQPRHHLRNTIFIDIAEGKVTTATYFLATNAPGRGGFAVVTATGIYEDEIVLTKDGWRIDKRIAVYD